MAKNKKFVVILAVFVLSAALLTGCVAGEGGETGQNGEVGLNDSENVNDSNQAETQAQDTATVSGTLKAVDAAAGTVTIATKSDGELVLEFTNESKILEGGSLSTLDQLAAKIDSEVDVEYHTITKTVTAISIQD